MDTESRIRRFMPIQRLSQPLQDRAVALANLHVCERGEVVYAQGASDDRVHYLVAGSVELIWHGKPVRTLSATNKAALQPLDPPGRKRYTVRAPHGATIAWFRRVALDRLVEQHESRLEAGEFEVAEIATERSSDWMIRMLQSELFTVLPATNIQKIFARMEQIALKADDVVVRQGSVGDYYYVIEKGYCEVSRTIAAGRGQIHLADLGPGTAFGEEALISGQPRNASVTMLSDGLLMRLGRDDFVELIQNEVLHPVSLEQALGEIDGGAVWLDIRYPEDHARQALGGSENIPLSMLRLQSNRLRKDFRYVVCGDDAEQCAIAAFLLGERGFRVVYLESGIAAALERYPELAAREADAAPTVVYLATERSDPHEDAPVNDRPDEPGMEEPDHDSPLDSTITRIAGLYTHEEAQREMNAAVPAEHYADTATGQALADIIGELGEQHDDLGGHDHPAAVAPPEAAAVAPDAHQGPPAADGIAAVFAEMEQRLRAELEQAVEQRRAGIEADYQAKLQRMRELTNEEIRQREAAIRRQVDSEYRDKEQLLRSYYKKLIALANNIARQKAQLQETRRQFDRKLTSANRLYREVEEMRELLSDHIDYLDQQQIAEIPRLSLTL